MMKPSQLKQSGAPVRPCTISLLGCLAHVLTRFPVQGYLAHIFTRLSVQGCLPHMLNKTGAGAVQLAARRQAAQPSHPRYTSDLHPTGHPTPDLAAPNLDLMRSRILLLLVWPLEDLKQSGTPVKQTGAGAVQVAARRHAAPIFQVIFFVATPLQGVVTPL